MLNNYNIALRRCKSLQRQLNTDPTLEDLYAKEMEKFIDSGDVEKVKESQILDSLKTETRSRKKIILQKKMA